MRASSDCGFERCNRLGLVEVCVVHLRRDWVRGHQLLRRAALHGAHRRLYEWKTDETGKHPYRFVMKCGEPFAMAGIYGRSKSSPLTFAILTSWLNPVEVDSAMDYTVRKSCTKVERSDGGSTGMPG